MRRRNTPPRHRHTYKIPQNFIPLFNNLTLRDTSSSTITSTSESVSMAAETNNDFYLRNALGRTESTNHRRITAAPARTSHDVHGLNTSGFVTQRPPGISDRADMTIQTDFDAWRTNAIATMERTPRRRHVEPAFINDGLHGLDNSGPVPQNLDLNRSAPRSADPEPEEPEAFSIEPYRRFFEGTSDQLLRQIEASDETQPVRRTDAYGLHNHEMNLDHLANEINTATSGVSNHRAETFLKSLPILSLIDLPDDNQDCPICMEKYLTPQHDETSWGILPPRTPSDRGSNPTDPPVRLPCNHIIGKDCLRSWLQSSVLNRNNNTCPMCRTVLYNRDILANQLRDIDRMIGHLPEGTRSRHQAERTRLEEASNRLRIAREQREQRAAPPRWQDMTTSTSEQLQELDRSNAALREDFVRLQEVNRARVEELNAMIPESDSAARLHVPMRPRREQVNRNHAEVREAFERQHSRMRARANTELDAEIAVRSDFGRPLRERRGAM